MARWRIVLLLVFVFAAPLHAADSVAIHVKPGESIQKAIDASPEAGVVTLEEGVYPDTVKINRPITLQGAGWDKTILQPAARSAHSQEDKLRFADALEAARTDQERMQLIQGFLRRTVEPTVSIKGARDVTIRGLRIQGAAPTSTEGMTGDPLVLIDQSQGQIAECGVIGPFMNGVVVSNGSDIEIRQSLIAAFWNTGVAVTRGDSRQPSTVHLVDSDIRNCYSRCVTIACEGSVIERCRISGSAWHGIRYDNVSPTITDNFIFGNARCGIYASGKTRATVSGNVFWKNEMDGVSCWYDNADKIEANTFVGNLREGIAVCGDASPTLAGNIFAENPVAVLCSQINERGKGSGTPQPQLQRNVFWQNQTAFKRLEQIEAIPDGNSEADPKFADVAKQDFALADDSPARAVNAGTARPLAAQSPWPIQAEERAIIPKTDTRDSRQWIKPKLAK